MTFARVQNPDVRVSVIIPYFQKASTVLRCIERLRTQTFHACSPDELEIIVIDDGTEGDDIRTRLPEEVIYLWQRKRLYGVSRARNTGARIANGKYLVFLDPDLLVVESYVDAVVRGFEQYGDRVVQAGYFWDYHFEGCPDPRTEFGVWDMSDGVSGRFLQLAGGNFAITRQLFSQTPGFDEAFVYSGMEDLVFGYQVGLMSGTAMYFNRAMLAWHLPHPPSPSHASPQASWALVKMKYPEFYDAYIVKGLR